MRSIAKVALAGIVGGVACTCLGAGNAHAQIPPLVERDPNWDTVSTVTMLIGVTSVSLMPRVYYSSPDATVGWKARWHVSALAPIMTLTGISLLVDGPIRDVVQNTRQGCSIDETTANLPDSGCESFGGPSSHAFASWGATGAGLGIFLVDTLKYSDGNFNVPSFLGNVAVPFTASIWTMVARSQDGSGLGHENTGQVFAGTLPGLGVGALLGVTYSLLQEPDCGYGGYLFCW
jgi:hypothetical protein